MAANQMEAWAGLHPDDMVKSCKYIEMGSCFSLDGIYACIQGTVNSPLLVTTEELNSGTLTHDRVVQRRQALFAALNGLAEGETGSCRVCANLKEKRFRDVDLTHLGGEPLTAGMNIQYYTACNQHCLYCCYAQGDRLIKPQYDMLRYLEMFREVGKLRGNNWIDFSGGEPTLLKEFDAVLGYLLDHDLGTVVVYSNATVFSQTLFEALRRNRVILTTSLDTGIASSYGRLRGSDSFPKVLRNLIRYRNSGTHQLWLKCVVCETNRSPDDLWSFVLAMLSLRPDKIQICPEFPYGGTEVAPETVQYVAQLWNAIEQMVGLTPVDYTLDFGDPLWVNYHEALATALADVRDRQVLGRAGEVQRLEPPRLRDLFKHRLGRVRGAIWRSAWRRRMVPAGSDRERRVMGVYRKTLGRFLGE